MKLTSKKWMLIFCLTAVLALTACNVLPQSRSDQSARGSEAAQSGLPEGQEQDAWGAEDQKADDGRMVQAVDGTADSTANPDPVDDAFMKEAERPQPVQQSPEPDVLTGSGGMASSDAVEASAKPLTLQTSATPVPEKRNGKRPDAQQAQSWYYIKQGKGNVPRFPVTAWFEPEQQVRWIGSGKTVYLTFDNGGGMGEIDKLLKAMDEFGVKASFFITGNNILKHPDSIRKLTAAGHLVLNHSMTHRDFTKMDDEAVLQEIRDTQKAIETVTGQKAPKCFRFPFGRFTSRQLDLIAAEGYRTYFWSTAMKDWVKRENGPIDAYNDVINNLHDGNMILMHQASEENTEALDDIIRTILDEGYRFGLVDEL